VISNVVVSYRVKPEAVAEHVRLIEAVFDELRAQHRTDVDYTVIRLADGVSFVHMSTSDTPDGSSPLPTLSSFQEFGRALSERVETPPDARPGDLIGRFASLAD
jgi:hypothetical protein